MSTADDQIRPGDEEEAKNKTPEREEFPADAGNPEYHERTQRNIEGITEDTREEIEEEMNSVPPPLPFLGTDDDTAYEDAYTESSLDDDASYGDDFAKASLDDDSSYSDEYTASPLDEDSVSDDEELSDDTVNSSDEVFKDLTPEDDVNEYQDLKERMARAIRESADAVRKGPGKVKESFFEKSDKAVSVTGSVTGAIGATGLGYLSINGVAAAAPFTNYIALPLAGAGNIIVDGIRLGKAKKNSRDLKKDKENTLTLAKYYENKDDLIDTIEEQAAAAIACKLGNLQPDSFPILPDEEAYAIEVYARISSLFTEEKNISDPKIQKFLGNELYSAYQTLIGHPTDAAEGKKYKKLQPEEVHQVAVQLGRMMYVYHMGKNWGGRLTGLAGSVAASMLTQTYLPGIVSAGYEAARYAQYRRLRAKSHLSINAKGELVNTADGKKELKLPVAPQNYDENAKPWKPEKLAALKEEVKDAKGSVKSLEEQIVALDEKIQTDTETKARYDAEIKKIENKKVDRQLTDDQQAKIDKLQTEKEEWEAKKRNAEGDSEDADNEITKLTREIDEKTKEAEPKQKKIAELRQEKLPHLDAIDKLQNEKFKLQQENSGTSATRIKAIDLEVRSLQSYVDSIDRKIKALNEEIKEIGLQYKEERLGREKKAKRKAYDDVALADRKIAEASKTIDRITAQGTSDRLTKGEEAEIEALQEKIIALKLGISEDRKNRLVKKKEDAEEKYKKLKAEFEKQEGIIEASEHHEDGFVKKVGKNILDGKVVQILKNETMQIGGSALGGAIVGGGGIIGLNYLIPASRFLVSSPLFGVGLGALGTSLYYIWKRATNRGSNAATPKENSTSK